MFKFYATRPLEKQPWLNGLPCINKFKIKFKKINKTCYSSCKFKTYTRNKLCVQSINIVNNIDCNRKPPLRAPKKILIIELMIMIRFVVCTYPPCWALKARIQKHRDKPLLFHDKCPGCITQHTGPRALRPIRRTKQLWLSVLLKDTSAATGQAGIQTHILATPELESNVLDRSATTAIEQSQASSNQHIKHRSK